MEEFPKKEKNLKPIEAADKLLKSIGISQFAESELSDNDKKTIEAKPEVQIFGRKHRGGKINGGIAPSVFERPKKNSGPGQELSWEDDLPPGYTSPYDGE